MRTQLPIQSMQDLVAMGEVFSASQMFGTLNPHQGFVIACTLHQTGMTSLEFVELYNVVFGRITMRADAMLAGLIKCGGKYNIIERSETRAAIEIQKGKKKEVFELTWADAEAEPFTKDKNGNLKAKYATPRSRMQMLWARVVSDSTRATYPQVVQGAYTPEEVEDFDEVQKAANGPLEIPGAENVTREALEESLKGDAGTSAATTVLIAQEATSATSETTPVIGPENPFPATNFEICPIPGVPMTGQRWDSLGPDHLKAALNIKHETMQQGHFSAINAVLATAGS